MPALPRYVNISLEDLVTLCIYYKAALAHPRLGELGVKSYSQTLGEINGQSHIRITPVQLEHLLYQFKETVMERVRGINLNLTLYNYNGMMKRIAHYNPHLFKTKETGEVVMINFRDPNEVGEQK